MSYKMYYKIVFVSEINNHKKHSKLTHIRKKSLENTNTLDMYQSLLEYNFSFF